MKYFLLVFYFCLHLIFFHLYELIGKFLQYLCNGLVTISRGTAAIVNLVLAVVQ